MGKGRAVVQLLMLKKLPVLVVLADNCGCGESSCAIIPCSPGSVLLNP